MLNIKNKTAAIVTSVAMMGYSVIPAFAAVEGHAVNDTTGADSSNSSVISVQQTTTLVQNNNADINNNVQLKMNTGNNSANKNTGVGEVRTGDVSFGTALSNKANSNVASLEACGGCDMDIQTVNNKTGADSWNKTGVEVTKTNDVYQTNRADVNNYVKSDVNTGGNIANKNTTAGAVMTGDAEGTVIVENDLNKNFASIRGGSNGGSVLGAFNDTTGADSDNESTIAVMFANLVSQSNNADVDNKVDLDMNTGNNKANKNTGVGEVVTGDVDLGVALDTVANENFLNFSGCCDVLFETANTKTGADSWNSSAVEVLSATSAFQSNCGDENYVSEFWYGGHHDNCGIDNFVGGQLNTGDNQTNKNTNDDVVTGEVEALVQVESDTNHNALGDLVMPDWDVEFPTNISGWGWMMWMMGAN